MAVPSPHDQRPAVWRPQPSAERALSELIGQRIRLPAVPALYAQVVTELESPRGSIEFVARLISREPALCAKILQTVNAAAFAPAQPITSAAEAVLFLGAERIKAVVLFATTVAPFDKATCENFSVSELWRHSMAVSGFAAKIAQFEKLSGQAINTAFTAGLLHDIGKLLFAGNIPQQYGPAITASKRRNVPLTSIEAEILQMTHADLGAFLLSSWGLPQEIVNAVAWHHAPRFAGDKVFSLVTAVHAANAIEHELHAPANDPGVMDADYLGEIGLRQQANYWRVACRCPVKN